ncbi:hypothetical protein ACLB2K_001462 [Fragaria x ananassa]
MFRLRKTSTFQILTSKCWEGCITSFGWAVDGGSHNVGVTTVVSGWGAGGAAHWLMDARVSRATLAGFAGLG